MTKLEEAIKKFPPVVQEQIVTGLEEAGIVELHRLKVILPALSKAIQISKPRDSEEYVVTMIDSRDGKVLIRESDEKKYSIADFISAFNFESALVDGRPTISRDEACWGNRGNDNLEEIAKGNLKVLPHPTGKTPKGSIPASVIEQGRRKGSPSTEDIASGKVSVDMSK